MYQHFNKELTNAFAKNDYVLITGDINIDYLKLLPSLGVRRLASVVCKLFTFQASSPKPLGQLECSLDGPLQSFCFSFQSDIQHGCQGQ